MTTQKTKIQIIEETVAAYADPSNRATDGMGYCEYRNKDGKMCAVGRCLDINNPDTIFSRGGTAIGLIMDHGDYIFDPEYRGHESKFWSELQILHDRKENFTKNGYSQIGLNYIESLKRFYANQ